MASAVSGAIRAPSISWERKYDMTSPRNFPSRSSAGSDRDLLVKARVLVTVHVLEGRFARSESEGVPNGVMEGVADVLPVLGGEAEPAENGRAHHRRRQVVHEVALTGLDELVDVPVHEVAEPVL